MPSIPVDTNSLALLEGLSFLEDISSQVNTSHPVCDILETAALSCGIVTTNKEHSSKSCTGLNHITQTVISSLKEEVTECSNTVPASLLDPTDKPDTLPLSVRTEILQLRFMAIKPRYRLRASELQNFYNLQTNNLQQERQQILQQSSPLFYNNVNQAFDIYHNKLVDRVEKSLSLLECKSAPVKQFSKSSFSRFLPDVNTSCAVLSDLCKTPIKDTTQDMFKFCAGKRKTLKPKFMSNLDPIATNIMKVWYENNKDYPYPSREACDTMAKSGNISNEQVRKWFANKRSRNNNTRSQEDIMLEKHIRKKRKSDEYQENSIIEKRLCLRYEQ